MARKKGAKARAKVKAKVSWLKKMRRGFAKRAWLHFGVTGSVLFVIAALLRVFILNGEDHVQWDVGFYWSIAVATTFGGPPEPKLGVERLLSAVWMVLAITYWSALFSAASAYFAGLLRK
jgi:hypothetical protein